MKLKSVYFLVQLVQCRPDPVVSPQPAGTLMSLRVMTSDWFFVLPFPLLPIGQLAVSPPPPPDAVFWLVAQPLLLMHFNTVSLEGSWCVFLSYPRTPAGLYTLKHLLPCTPSLSFFFLSLPSFLAFPLILISVLEMYNFVLWEGAENIVYIQRIWKSKKKTTNQIYL